MCAWLIYVYRDILVRPFTVIIIFLHAALTLEQIAQSHFASTLDMLVPNHHFFATIIGSIHQTQVLQACFRNSCLYRAILIRRI